MTGQHPPWPIGLVTGILGSGKTTLISRLLRHPDMADTLVLVNEFGEVGLDHHLLRAVTDDVVLLPNGCLCCTIRRDIVQTLRDLHRAWLAGTLPDFGQVIIETTGLAEPAPLVASLGSHPLLVDIFALQTITTLVDAEYGLQQLARNTTCRNQICVADHLVIAKRDLGDAGSIAVLRERLTALNPLATLRYSQDVDEPDLIFERAATRPRSTFFCDEATGHLTGISTLLLRAETPLIWLSFKLWLSQVLDNFGPQLIRLKGCLTFDANPAPVIIQAVHHTFYPIVEAPAGADRREDGFLVLIFEGDIPPELAQGFEPCRIMPGGP
jgi:G3E family GTPase